MSQEAYPQRTTVPEGVTHKVSFVGGTTAVTKIAGTGRGVVVSYAGVGLVDLIWQENPGNLIGYQGGFQATTIAQLKGYTVVAGDPSYSSSTGKTTVRLNIFDSTFTLANLTASQRLHLAFEWMKASTAL